MLPAMALPSLRLSPGTTTLVSSRLQGSRGFQNEQGKLQDHHQPQQQRISSPSHRQQHHHYHHHRHHRHVCRLPHSRPASSIGRVVAAGGRHDYNEYADREGIADSNFPSTRSNEERGRANDIRNTPTGNRSTSDALNVEGHEWGRSHGRASAVAGAVVASLTSSSLAAPSHALAAAGNAAAISAALAAAAAAEAAAEAAAYAAEAAIAAAEAAAEAAEAAAEAAAAAAEAAGAAGGGAGGAGMALQNAVWQLASVPLFKDLHVDVDHLLSGSLSSLPSSLPLSLSLSLPFLAQVGATPIAVENIVTTTAALSVTGGSAAGGAAAAAAGVGGAAAAALGEWQDPVMGLVTLLGSLIWVRLFDELARRDLIERKLSRKLVHITTGLLFMLFWPLFSTSFNARFFASAVPLINATRLVLLGLGVTRNEGMVKAMSREGSSSELLGGPLYYILTLAFVTITFWRSSPVGGMALALMCGGDGIADIVGRRVGSSKLPWNDQKSWAGSIAMLLFGYGLALGTIHLFTAVGFYSSDWLLLPNLPLRVFLVSLGATVVESLPLSDKLDDNLTVPLSTVLFGLLLLH